MANKKKPTKARKKKPTKARKISNRMSGDLDKMPEETKDVPMPGVPLTVDGMQKMVDAVEQTVSERLDNYSEGLGLLATERAKSNFEAWDTFPGEVQDGIVTWAAIGLLVEANGLHAENAHEALRQISDRESELETATSNRAVLRQSHKERGELIASQAKEIVRLGGSAKTPGDETLHGSVDTLTA